MSKRKTHYGISRELCGHRGSYRTNDVSGVTCKHCVKGLLRAALAFSS